MRLTFGGFRRSVEGVAPSGTPMPNSANAIELPEDLQAFAEERVPVGKERQRGRRGA